MGLSIDGLSSYSAYQGLLQSQNDLSKTESEISSGSSLLNNSNPSGLSINAILNAQTSGLNIASANAQNGISLLQTAGSALGQTTDILQSIRSLALQAANGTNDSASLAALGNQVTQQLGQIDQIASSTTFGSANLLDGSQSSGLSFQIGSSSGAGSTASISLPNSGSAALGLSGIDSQIANGGNISSVLSSIDSAISSVGATGSDIGSTINSLASSIDDITASQDNLTNASSGIGGVDIAQLSTQQASDKIKSQFSTALLAQANSLNRQNATQLLAAL